MEKKNKHMTSCNRENIKFFFFLNKQEKRDSHVAVIVPRLMIHLGKLIDTTS